MVAKNSIQKVEQADGMESGEIFSVGRFQRYSFVKMWSKNIW